MLLPLVLLAVDRCARLRREVFDGYSGSLRDTLLLDPVSDWLRRACAGMPRTYAAAIGHRLDFDGHVFPGDGLVGDGKLARCIAHQSLSIHSESSCLRSEAVRPKR